MKVVIRADGGGLVGWGHLSRCSALAEVLVTAGSVVEWACRAEAAIERFVGSSPRLALPGDPTLGSLPIVEAEAVSVFAQDADWIFVDHYGADSAYLEALREHSRARVMVFDDHQVRQGADLRLAPTQAAAANTLAGPAFQPIRACFTRTPQAARREGWLLALGGADPNDDTAACLAGIQSDRSLLVLASDAIAERQGLDGLLSVQTRRVPWLAPESLAVAIGAVEAALVSSSTLSWEALAMGTPIVALQTADNQEGVVRTLREAGVPVFTAAAEAAAAMRDGLARTADPGARLDGLGAWRVARAMGAKVELEDELNPASGGATLLRVDGSER
ncbi:MAG: hypothetical protein CMP23_12670 [Rickettsiales bacterium]|nr:hypothetical protein [Rickettsiales bacterium]